MSDLVLPPWDLCGFDRDFDPYSMTMDEWLARECGPIAAIARRQVLAAEREALSALGANARDGEWPELAFMPHRAVWPIVELWEDAEHLRRAGVRSERSVPEYLTVREALVRERMIRSASSRCTISDATIG